MDSASRLKALGSSLCVQRGRLDMKNSPILLQPGLNENQSFALRLMLIIHSFCKREKRVESDINIQKETFRYLAADQNTNSAEGAPKLGSTTALIILRDVICFRSLEQPHSKPGSPFAATWVWSD